MDMRTPPLKRGELGIAGSIIVIAQMITSYQSTTSVSSDIRELRADIEDIRKDQDHYFAKKDQLKSVEAKLEVMNSKLKEIEKQIKGLRSDYAFIPETETECKGESHASLI